ncbi:hypothetical protein [Bacillus sp. CH_203]|uniref:hypothetical protein n=1 Tax=Bacillus sp. CH_203 TaxID=2978216 RepID=UPI0030FA2F3E|nr:hypothetical protein [Bacillus cereus]
MKTAHDLFIVSELEESKCVDMVNDALFGTGSSSNVTGMYMAQPKYNLISFSTGGRLYKENLLLSDLIRKLENNGSFKVVSDIEFIER